MRNERRMKSPIATAAAAVAGMLLTGCGAAKSTFSVRKLYMWRRMVLVSKLLVKEYEGDTVNSKDPAVPEAAIRFNQENGAQGMMGGE